MLPIEKSSVSLSTLCLLTPRLNARRKQDLALSVHIGQIWANPADAGEISARQRATATAARWCEHAVMSGAMHFAASVKAGGFTLVLNQYKPQTK